MQSEIDTFKADSVRADKFIELVRQYASFEQLATAALNRFIDKVVIHECDKSSGKRIQKVDVYLNFIGNFDVPDDPPTLEELAAECEQDERRRKRREYQRQYRERKRAAILASVR